MKYIYYFFWLAGQAWRSLFYIWPVTAALSVLLVAALVFAVIRNRESLIKNMKFLPVPLAGTVMALLVGTVFENKAHFEWAASVSAGLTILLSGISIYKTKGIRALSITGAALILWFTSWCIAVSSVSIVSGWV